MLWIGIVTCPGIGQFMLEAEQKEKRMNARQLTTVAALPSGGGCMSALPAEVGEQPKVQMKAPYFEEQEEEDPLPVIDLGMIGGTGC